LGDSVNERIASKDETLPKARDHNFPGSWSTRNRERNGKENPEGCGFEIKIFRHGNKKEDSGYN
jgi:hypothetical protein